MITLYFEKKVGTATFNRKRKAVNILQAINIVNAMEDAGCKFIAAYEGSEKLEV